jgi:hypothetical protein
VAEKKAEVVEGKSEANQVPAKVGEKAAEVRAAQHQTIGLRDDASTGRDRIIHESSGKFHFELARFFVKPWLLLCRELYAFFSADAQSFSSLAQIALLS